MVEKDDDRRQGENTQDRPRRVAYDYTYSQDPALQVVIEKAFAQLTTGERRYTTPDRLHRADIIAAVYSVLCKRLEQKPAGTPWYEQVPADTQLQRLEAFKQEVATTPDQVTQEVVEMFWATTGTGGN